MNSLKNLMIIAVLAAVGYGVYASLARNNADPGQPPGVAEGWPTAPKVEFPSTKASLPPGGPLALSGSTLRPSAAASSSVGGTAPPFVPPAAASSVGMSPSNAPGITPALPYPSSNPASPSTPSSNPMATLGTPVPPDSVAAIAAAPAGPPGMSPPADAVRNLPPPPEGLTAGGPAPKAASPTENLLQSKFIAFMGDVQKALDERKFAEAHLALSKLYGNPDLPADQARQVTDLLDRLAGTVVYSREYHLEPPYVTQLGDTFDKIAQRYCVPWELLARINGMMPPSPTEAVKDQPLPVGRELKVVRGPFNAVVRLGKHELTLMLQDRYAGRFPIGVGRDQPKLEGSYTVREKVLSPTYYGPDGVNISPNDPKNPLGRAWIGLTDRIGIHGLSDPQCVGRDDNRGTIGVNDRDLQDLYGILTVGSRVTVVR